MAVSPLQQQQFVSQYGPYAAQAGAALNVNPVIILGQWANESGWGTSSAAGNNNLAGLSPGGSLASYESPQAFTSAYVSTIQSNFPNAVGAGSDPSAFVSGLENGTYGKYFTSDPNQYLSNVASAGQTIVGINPNLASADMAQGPNVAEGYGTAPTGVTPSIDVGGPTYNPSIPAGQQGSQYAPTGTGTSTGSLGNIASGVIGDPGYLPPAQTGGVQETGLAPGTVTSIGGWIGGIESAVGNSVNKLWQGTVGQIENLALRTLIVFAAVVLIAVALWRLLDPDGSKLTTAVKGAVAA